MAKWLIALDMDGTLIVSTEATTRCLMFLHLMLGLDNPSRQDIQRLEGESASEILESILRLKTSDPAKYLRDIVRWADCVYPKNYMWRYSVRVPEVAKAIRELSQLGYVLILSSNVGNAVRELISREGIENLVEPLSPRYAYETKRARLTTAQRTRKIPSSNTVYVGDTLADVRFGRELGVRTIGDLRSSRGFEEIVRLADYTVQDITEVPAILRSWPQAV